MSTDCIADRLAKLRALRENLCNKEKNWTEAFQARDWIVDQLNHLRKMTTDNTNSTEDIRNRIDDILCVLDPSDSTGGNDV
jgi:hypothetical protein